MSSEEVDPEGGAAPAPPSPPPPPPRPPCERCGTFAELRPSAGQQLCAACIERLHPIEREPLTAGTVIAGVWHVLKRIGLPSALLLVLFEAPMSAMQMLLPDLPSMVGTGYSLTVTVLANAAVMIMAHAVVTGEGPTEVMPALRQASQKWMGVATTNFFATVLIAIGFIVCIVPGLIAAFALAVALPVTIHEGSSGTAALKTSWQHMKSRLGVALAAYAVWSAPLVLLGVVPIAIAFALAMAEDPTLQQPASDPAFVVIDVMSFLIPALSVPTVILPAVLYPKLRVAANTRRLTDGFAASAVLPR